jgi:hypothetical protein
MKRLKIFVNRLACLLFLILFISGCDALFYTTAQNTKQEISDSDVKKYSLTNNDLMSLQYYNDKAFIFKTSDKYETNTQKDISSAKLTSSTTVYRNEIRIPAMTPGVAVKIENGYIYIDFGNNIIIPFSMFGHFGFVIDYKEGTYYKKSESLEKITINGIEYVADIEDNYKNYTDDYCKYFEIVNLQVDLSKFESSKSIIQQQTAPGRTLNK